MFSFHAAPPVSISCFNTTLVRFIRQVLFRCPANLRREMNLRYTIKIGRGNLSHGRFFIFIFCYRLLHDTQSLCHDHDKVLHICDDGGCR